MDLRSLKERLRDELHEIGIDNLPSVPTSTPKKYDMEDPDGKVEEGGDDEKPLSMVVGCGNVSTFNEDNPQQEPCADFGRGVDNINVGSCGMIEPGTMDNKDVLELLNKS